MTMPEITYAWELVFPTRVGNTEPGGRFAPRR